MRIPQRAEQGANELLDLRVVTRAPEPLALRSFECGPVHAPKPGIIEVLVDGSPDGLEDFPALLRREFRG